MIGFLNCIEGIFWHTIMKNIILVPSSRHFPLKIFYTLDSQKIMALLKRVLQIINSLFSVKYVSISCTYVSFDFKIYLSVMLTDKSCVSNTILL